LGIIVRQSIANSIMTYMGIGLGFLLTIFLYPHILNPDQYGLTRVLISAAIISSQFAHLGFNKMVIRYFPFFSQAKPRKHGLLFWAFVVPMAGFILFTVLYLLGSDLLIRFYSEQSPLFVNYYLWVIPLTLFVLYFEVLNNYLRSLRDTTTGSFVNEVSQRLLVIIILGFYFFEWISFTQFIILFVISYGSQPLLIMLQIWRKEEFRIKPNFDILRKPLIKGMANYGLYSLLGGLTTILVWNVDVMMLGSMAGLEATAIYAIAFYIASVITVPQRSIEKIATPLLADFIKNKQWDEVLSIYRKTSINQLILGLFIFGLIWVNLDALFLLLPDVYAAGKWVVFIVGIGKLIEMVTGSNGIILINSKHYRVGFYTNIILVGITILANYLLIPIYGIEGAAIASAFALFVYNCVKYFYLWFRMNLQPFTGSTVFTLILGSAAIYISYAILQFDSVWINIPVKSVAFVIIFLVPALWLKLSPDLNQLLGKIFYRINSSKSTDL